MDMHVFCADRAVRSLDGLTAFSALPNAPVLPVKQRRHPLRALRVALRRRQPAGVRASAPKPVIVAADPCI
jgi:hypothetical protein